MSYDFYFPGPVMLPFYLFSFFYSGEKKSYPGENPFLMLVFSTSQRSCPVPPTPLSADWGGGLISYHTVMSRSDQVLCVIGVFPPRCCDGAKCSWDVPLPPADESGHNGLTVFIKPRK